MKIRGQLRTGLFLILAASVVSAAVGSNAFALSIIDFTDGSWNGAQGRNSFTTHGSGIDLFAAPSPSARLTVNYIGGPSGDNSGRDGLGINDDEITFGAERLKIVFSAPVTLNSVFITDLFRNEGPRGQSEVGLYSLNGGAFTSFASSIGGGPNGELTLNISRPNISSITFKARTDTWSDYSVRGLTYQAQSVPEPATLLLLGPGLVGLAAWKRKQAA